MPLAQRAEGADCDAPAARPEPAAPAGNGAAVPHGERRSRADVRTAVARTEKDTGRPVTRAVAELAAGLGARSAAA